MSRQVETLAPRIAALAHARIDAFEAKGAAELIAEFATPIPVAVIADLLGVPREMGPQLLDWSHRMVAMYQFGVTRAVEEARPRRPPPRSPTSCARYARARRADLRDDLISQLLRAESDGGRLSEDELVTTCILLLNAGHEATVHAIGNGVKAMLEHRHRRAGRLRRRQASRAAAVEELLRLDAPLHLFTRYALEDVEFAGVRLAEGREDRSPARRRQPRPRALSRTRTRSTPGAIPIPHRRLRRGHPFLRRRAAGAARNGDGAADPVRPLPGLRLAERPRYRDAYHFHGLEALSATWG